MCHLIINADKTMGIRMSGTQGLISGLRAAAAVVAVLLPHFLHRGAQLFICHTRCPSLLSPMSGAANWREMHDPQSGRV